MAATHQGMTEMGGSFLLMRQSTSLVDVSHEAGTMQHIAGQHRTDAPTVTMVHLSTRGGSTVRLEYTEKEGMGHARACVEFRIKPDAVWMRCPRVQPFNLSVAQRGVIGIQRVVRDAAHAARPLRRRLALAPVAVGRVHVPAAGRARRVAEQADAALVVVAVADRLHRVVHRDVLGVAAAAEDARLVVVPRAGVDGDGERADLGEGLGDGVCVVVRDRRSRRCSPPGTQASRRPASRPSSWCRGPSIPARCPPS
jgi:hypothetical protein